ncbi:MAG: CsgG/HfaB family protein [Celeribacter sp.]|jgi:hypothetical protein
MKLIPTIAALAALLATSACSTIVASKDTDLALAQGPAIADIVTPFDDALLCLRGKINKGLTFAVGGIPDQTGTYQNNGEGVGKFVTQGAGDIVQSALFKSGVTLINRRDMGTTALEGQWGLIDLRAQKRAHFVVTGSINSLDFIPGGGAALTVGGVGPNYRQNRILVGLDLAMTNVSNGQIYANVALRKQIFADEFGLLTARFINDNVVDFELGGARREAVNYALRQMLQLASYELLVQMMPAEKYVECSAKLDAKMGRITGDQTSAEQLREFDEKRAAELAALAAQPLGTQVSRDEAAPAQTGAQAGAQTGAAQTQSAPQTAEFDPESPVARTARSASAITASSSGMASPAKSGVPAEETEESRLNTPVSTPATPAGAVCAGAAPPPPCRQARATAPQKTPQKTPQTGGTAENAAQNDPAPNLPGGLPGEAAPGDRVEALPAGPLSPMLPPTRPAGDTKPLRDAALLPPLRDIPTTGPKTQADPALSQPVETSAMLRRPMMGSGAGVETSDRLGA